jgi:hypothetical protein
MVNGFNQPRTGNSSWVQSNYYGKGDGMTRIILDDAMKAKLHNLAEPLELCDEGGRVLAKVTPCYDPIEVDLDPKISQEEIERISASNEKGLTTAELLAYLEKL